MKENGKPPDLSEEFRKWVFRRFGIFGLIALLFIVAITTIVWHWDKVSKLPVVSSLAALCNRWPIPQADHSRFSVLVAHLEYDDKGEQEKLIVEALREFEGIQVLNLDRTIPLSGPVPEEMEKRGHNIARYYLEKSGASVLIWGMVLGRGGKTTLKLYWTPSKGDEWKPRRYPSPLAEEQLRLPEVFWSDILRLFVATADAEFPTEEGHYVADRLPPIIDRVRTLLSANPGYPGWDIDTRCNTQLILAYSLKMLGEQSGKKQQLEEAVETYRQVLHQWTRERDPLKWAMTKNELGLALTKLGDREIDTKHLKEALATFEESLEIQTRERMPRDWAETQNNLGLVLKSLGDRESNPDRLKRAVTSFRDALKEFSRDRDPINWAVIKTNLGNALTKLGKQEGGTSQTEEAIAVLREALQEHKQNRVPLNWAVTQNNLGMALSNLGQRKRENALLEEAVTVIKAALTEHTRERVPLQWAMIQNNLGLALTNLGERTGNKKSLEEAVMAYRTSLNMFKEMQATYYVEVARVNLHRTEFLLKEQSK